MRGLRSVIPELGTSLKIKPDELMNFGFIANLYSKVYYVDSVNGSDGNDGLNNDSAKATLLGAINAATANNGDIILVLSGHVETIANATALKLNKAGLTIIGLGTGTRRPTFTFTTATSANIPVSADNILLSNLVFISNFAAVVSCFTVAAAKSFYVQDCEFRDTDSTHNFVAIVTTTVSTSSDDLRFQRNRVVGFGTTAGTTPIKILNTIDRVTIEDNYINLAVLNNTSAVLAHAALVVTNLLMQRNRIFRPNTDTATGGILITTSSTTNTGMVADNYVSHADVAAAILVTAGCKYGMMNNLADGDADASGFVLPAIGSDS